MYISTSDKNLPLTCNEPMQAAEPFADLVERLVNDFPSVVSLYDCRGILTNLRPCKGLFLYGCSITLAPNIALVLLSELNGFNYSQLCNGSFRAHH